MKKILMVIILVLFLFSVGNVLATPSINADFNFAEHAPTDDSRYKTVSQTFQIKNNGPENLTGITINPNFSSDYEVAITNDGCSGKDLNVSSSPCDIEIKYNMSSDMTIGTRFNLGTIGISASSTNGSLSENIPVTALLENMLEIDKITISGDKVDVDNEDSIINVAPGDKVDVVTVLKNLFDSDKNGQNVDIKDVNIEFTVNGLGEDGDDIDETDDISVISPGNKKTNTISFDVPYKVDEDNYDGNIVIDAEDENGFQYKYDINFQIRVKKDGHALKIIGMDLSPETLSCGTFSTLNIDVMNLGRSTEENVVIKAISSDLGLNEKWGPFDMSKDPTDDSYEERMDFTVNKGNIAPGTYAIDVYVYFDFDKVTDKQTRKLTIKSCGTDTTDTADTTSNDSSSDNSVVIYNPQPTTPTQPAVTSGGVVLKDTSGSFFNSTTFLIMLGVGILIVLWGIVSLLKKL